MKDTRKNQPVLENPLDKYRTQGFPKQEQKAPGLQDEMTPVPDSGEESYVGHGILEGRKALITGGDSGIGRAVAIAYAREGADVAVNYLPFEEEDAESLKELLEKEGRKIALIPGDVSVEETCHQIVEKAYEALGGLDILVLNAGMQVAVKDIMDISTEQLTKTFETNVFSMFWTVQAALPKLPAGSAIITTTSIQAYKPSAYLVDYASSKAAIMAFTRALAGQLAEKGIRVNSVAPGPVWTPLEISGGQLQENLKSFGQDTPLKRAGQPAELAGPYVFLASNAASYVTAEVYGVTGGDHTF